MCGGVKIESGQELPINKGSTSEQFDALDLKTSARRQVFCFVSRHCLTE